MLVMFTQTTLGMLKKATSRKHEIRTNIEEERCTALAADHWKTITK